MEMNGVSVSLFARKLVLICEQGCVVRIKRVEIKETREEMSFCSI